jgi:hypothetical protein
MIAYEFAAQVTHQGQIELPPPLLKALSGDQRVRVIVLVDEATNAQEEAVWSRFTAEQFLAGYSEADAIYDRL